MEIIIDFESEEESDSDNDVMDFTADGAVEIVECGMMKRATVMKTECFKLCRWKTLIYNKTCFEIVFGKKFLSEP